MNGIPCGNPNLVAIKLSRIAIIVFLRMFDQMPDQLMCSYTL